MILNRLNLTLACALVLVLAVLMLTRVDYSRPNYRVNLGDDMTDSPAFTSFEANDNFANGRTMQDPVPSTIPRSMQPFHFEATGTAMWPAWREVCLGSAIALSRKTSLGDPPVRRLRLTRPTPRNLLALVCWSKQMAPLFSPSHLA